MSERHKVGNFIEGGSFDLYVGFDLDYTRFETGVIDYVCHFFNVVSCLLYRATHRKHYISTIEIGFESDERSFDIVFTGDLDSTDVGDARVWNSASMIFSLNHLYSPGLMLHELGHYLYDLRDEYGGCRISSSEPASIMEWDFDNVTRYRRIGGEDYHRSGSFQSFWDDYKGGIGSGGVPGDGIRKGIIELIDQEVVADFCNDYLTSRWEHDSNTDTDQNNQLEGRSCWNVLEFGTSDEERGVAFDYNLKTPDLIDFVTPHRLICNPYNIEYSNQFSSNPLSINFAELIPEYKFILVLDQSPNWTNTELDQLKEAGSFWIDYINRREVLGIITFSSSAKEVIPLSEVPANVEKAAEWRKERHKILYEIVSSSSKLKEEIKSKTKKKALVEALKMGSKSIIARGIAVGQSMLLISDGNQFGSLEAIEEILKDIIAFGIKIYTVGIGKGQNASLLNYIATATRGRYFRVTAGLDDGNNMSSLTDALAQVAGYSRTNSGIVSFDAIDGSVVKEIYDPSENIFPFDSKLIDSPREITSFEFPVKITEGSSNCTIGALWKKVNNDSFKVEVYNPDDKKIRSSKKVRLVEGRSYSFYVINNPKSGRWKVKVIGSRIREAKFRTIGFEINNKLNLLITTINSQVEAGKPIKMIARSVYEFPIAGVEIKAVINSPSGKRFVLPFREQHEKKNRGSYSLEIPTIAKEFGQYIINVKAYQQRSIQKFVPDHHGLNKKNENGLFIRKGYKPGDEIIDIKVPEFIREEFIFVSTDRVNSSTFNIRPGRNTKRAFIPEGQNKLLKKWKKEHGVK